MVQHLTRCDAHKVKSLFVKYFFILTLGKFLYVLKPIKIIEITIIIISVFFVFGSIIPPYLLAFLYLLKPPAVYPKGSDVGVGKL